MPVLEADWPRCMNCGVKSGEACNAPLDAHGDHAALCEHGPLRNKRHNDYAEEVGEIVAEAGALVRRETPIAEFTTSTAEAVLDVWGFGCRDLPDLLLDVTIRHPGAARHLDAAARVPGATARQAEKDKTARYPPSGGRSVVPFAVETWGRLGDGAEDLLQCLAAAAAHHARRRGQDCEASGRLKSWRAILDASVQRGVAEMQVAARYGLPGRPLQRRGPRQESSLGL